MPLKGESLRELSHLQRRINLMFQEMIQPESGHTALPAYVWAPAADVCEDETAFYIDVELPGVPLDSVTVACDENRLKISGERKPSRELSPETVQRVERYFGPFLREVAFPGPVDAKGVTAALADGLLTVKVPKKKTSRKRIPVK